MTSREDLESRKQELIRELDQVNHALAKKGKGHEQTSLDGCMDILRCLTVEGKLTEQMYNELDGKYGKKAIRWVMRRYGIRHTPKKPYRYFLSDEKVSDDEN